MTHRLFGAGDCLLRAPGKGMTLAAIGTIARRGAAFCGPTTSARVQTQLIQ
jgi:hypothetical protein